MNWKTEASAAVTAAAAPVRDPDAELGRALEQALNDDMIPAKDKPFAQSLLRGYTKFGGFTAKQRPYVERMIGKQATAEVKAAPSQDDALAAQLTDALTNTRLAEKDESFAKSLLNGYTKFGGFTDRQRPYVERLINSAIAPTAPKAPEVMYPNTAALFALGRFSRFAAFDLMLARRNDGSFAWVWVKLDEIGAVALLEMDGRLVLTRRGAPHAAAIHASMVKIEADPMAAAAEYGILTGRCGCCSRELTDPVSIERGIGPICAEKF
jgi:hypothetical protein